MSVAEAPIAPATKSPAPKAPAKKKRRKRFRFSLNGLAIQLSAFALSFTLVALLVVSGSQAAFVEQSPTLDDYVPIGTAAPTPGAAHRGRTSPASPAPVVSESPAPLTTEPELPAVSEPPATPTPQPPDAEITLTDTAAGTAMFGNETLRPGVPVERCIAVSYAGNVDVAPVRLYAAATSGDLAPYLDLTITIGAPASGPASSCGGFSASGTLYSGTLAGFAATHSSYATGQATWTPAGSQETRGFRFSLTLRDEPAASGKSATFGFSWRTEAT